jgi:hypothetical protein
MYDQFAGILTEDEDGGVNGLPYPKKSQIGGGYLMSIRSAGIRWDRAWRP